MNCCVIRFARIVPVDLSGGVFVFLACVTKKKKKMSEYAFDDVNVCAASSGELD